MYVINRFGIATRFDNEFYALVYIVVAVYECTSIYCSLAIGIVFIHLFLVRSLDTRYNNTHTRARARPDKIRFTRTQVYTYSKPID